jgi:hypothetical protein
LFFVATMTLQTVSQFEAPLDISDLGVYAYPENDDTVVVYSRNVKAKEHIHFTMQRTLECHLSQGRVMAHDLPPVFREMEQGETKSVNRVVSFPVALPVGTKCFLHSDIRWAPQFSISDHVYHTNDVEFFVSKEPYHVN